MEYVGSGNSTENDALVERIAHTVEKLSGVSKNCNF